MVVTAGELRSAHGEQKQRHADGGKKDAEDEDAARRIAGEAVNRCQQPRADDEGADKRQREGKDRQQDGPAFQPSALFDDDGRMKKRRRREPWHQRGVLDRVPEPPSAPAELVIGPPAAERDSGRQRTPGRRHPGPHMARPVAVDAALDEPGDGEGEGKRQSDIADIECRRVKRQPRVLEDRVQAAAVQRRGFKPRERVRGEKAEGEKTRRHHRLDSKRADLQAEIDGLPAQRQQAAEQRQDQDPQQQRALMVPPGA